MITDDTEYAADVAAARVASVKRTKAWLASLKDSPGLRLAHEIASTWDSDGPEKASALFKERAESMKMVRWEQIAVCDMVTAIRLPSSE